MALTFLSGFWISGNTAQNGLITSKNFTVPEKENTHTQKKRRQKNILMNIYEFIKLQGTLFRLQNCLKTNTLFLKQLKTGQNVKQNSCSN